MNLILFTGDSCKVCHDAEEIFKKKFKAEIDSGECDVVNLDEDEGAQQFWAENDLPVAPIAAVVSDAGRLMAILEAPSSDDEKDDEKGTKETSPTAAEVAK